ncbi:UNVERIFIED_CONTAM: hypothetical protein FKN15_014880 [Acipenser sinensis]
MCFGISSVWRSLCVVCLFVSVGQPACAVRHNRDTIAKGSSDPSKMTIGLITIDWNRVFPGSPILAKWGVVSCTAVGLALVLGLVLWYKCVYKRKKRRKEEEDEEIGAQLKRERKEEEMKETERGEEEEGEGEEGGVETETGGEGEEQRGAVVEKATVLEVSSE